MAPSSIPFNITLNFGITMRTILCEAIFKHFTEIWKVKYFRKSTKDHITLQSSIYYSMSGGNSRLRIGFNKTNSSIEFSCFPFLIEEAFILLLKIQSRQWVGEGDASQSIVLKSLYAHQGGFILSCFLWINDQFFI